MKKIAFTLNQETVTAEVFPHITLADLLRDHFQLTGTKVGCGRGECGACTVILDGMAVNSCLTLAIQVDGRSVTTVEGLAAKDGSLHPIQRAFIDQGAVQCGFCTPGMVVMAKSLLGEIPNPTEEEVKKGIGGNLCRCTGYKKIIKAIQSVQGK